MADKMDAVRVLGSFSRVRRRANLAVMSGTEEEDLETIDARNESDTCAPSASNATQQPSAQAKSAFGAAKSVTGAQRSVQALFQDAVEMGRNGFSDTIGFALRPAYDVGIKLDADRSDGCTNESFALQGPLDAIEILSEAERCGSLSPITPITVPQEARDSLGIPDNAISFAYAYPLPVEDADTVGDLIDLATQGASKPQEGAGSASETYRVEAWLNFVLVGGYCYFDSERRFLHANALTPRLDVEDAVGRVNLQGPLPCAGASGEALQAAGRLRPVTLPSLTSIGFTAFAWINPNEEAPGGIRLLPSSVSLANGGFLYHAPATGSSAGALGGSSGDVSGRGQWFCYRMALEGEPPPATLSPSQVADGSSAAPRPSGESIGGASDRRRRRAGTALDSAIRSNRVGLVRSIARAAKRQQLREVFTQDAVWGVPTRGVDADDAESPSYATCFERVRDWWLRQMVAHQFPLFVLALLGTAGFVVALGFLILFWLHLNLGVDLGRWSASSHAPCDVSAYNASEVLFAGSRQYPPRTTRPGVTQLTGEQVGEGGYVAHWCSPAQWWFNVTIKYTSYYFLYINALPIPWTLSTVVHAFCPRDANAAKPGRDFYGRRSRSIWFHLPASSRRLVSSLMLFALLVQIPDAACHTLWYSYLMTQAWPGALLTNLWLVVQLSCQISASCIQSAAERRVRHAAPGRFPPTLTTYLVDARRRWQRQADGQPRRFFCGEGSFLRFIRAELRKYQRELAKFSEVRALTGIHVNEVKGRRSAMDLHRMLKGASRATHAATSLEAMARGRTSVAKVAPQAGEPAEP